MSKRNQIILASGKGFSEMDEHFRKVKKSLKKRKDWIYWFRWIALIPIAFVIGFIALFFLYWLIYLVFVDGNIYSEASIQSFMDTFSPIIMIIIMVSIGYLIAPEHKFKTCIVLALLSIIAFIIF